MFAPISTGVAINGLCVRRICFNIQTAGQHGLLVRPEDDFTCWRCRLSCGFFGQKRNQGRCGFFVCCIVKISGKRGRLEKRIQGCLVFLTVLGLSLEKRIEGSKHATENGFQPLRLDLLDSQTHHRKESQEVPKHTCDEYQDSIRSDMWGIG